jgi:hypothetical protein
MCGMQPSWLMAHTKDCAQSHMSPRAGPLSAVLFLRVKRWIAAENLIPGAHRLTVQGDEPSGQAFGDRRPSGSRVSHWSRGYEHHTTPSRPQASDPPLQLTHTTPDCGGPAVLTSGDRTGFWHALQPTCVRRVAVRLSGQYRNGTGENSPSPLAGQYWYAASRSGVHLGTEPPLG